MFTNVDYTFKRVIIDEAQAIKNFKHFMLAKLIFQTSKECIYFSHSKDDLVCRGYQRANNKVSVVWSHDTRYQPTPPYIASFPS